MPLRPCLGCGRRTDRPDSRCPRCAAPRNRATLQAKRARRPRLPGEDQRRAQAVAQHRAKHGNWCPGWGRPAHAATDLTADHPRAVGRGGDERQPLAVLCRRCNGRKADRQ